MCVVGYYQNYEKYCFIKCESFTYTFKYMLGAFEICNQKNSLQDFPDGPVLETPPSNAGDISSIPSWGTKIFHCCWECKLVQPLQKEDYLAVSYMHAC